MTKETKAAEGIVVGVELIANRVHIVLRGQLGAEEATLRLPVTPPVARALASELLGAAAVADPAGHQAIVDQIAGMVEAYAAGTLSGGPGQAVH